MSNYSTKIQTTLLNENGLAIEDGWIVVYHVDHMTREYQGASYEYVMCDVGIPADSYADEPELPPAGMALRRSVNGSEWEHAPDYRGQTSYNIETREAQTITQIGELSELVTLLQPSSAFDRWSGTEWVIDNDAKQAAAVKTAQRELATRKSAASSRINELTYAVSLDIATDAEKMALTEWQKYAVLLSRVDVTEGDGIVWPSFPVL